MSLEPSPPQRPRLWEAWTQFQLLVFALLLLGAELFWWTVVFRLTENAFAASVASVALAVVLPCGAAAWWHGETLLQAFQIRARFLPVVAGVAAGLLSWAPASYLASLSAHLRPPSPEYLDLLAANLPKTQVEMVVAYLAVAVAAPIGEELIFRGLFFRVLRDRWGFVRAMVLTALFFGVVHLAPWHLFGLVALGLLLALLYQLTGSLLAPMLAHASYNVVALTLLIRASATEEATAAAGLGSGGWTLLVASAALLLGLLVWLWRRSRPTDTVRPEDGWR